MGTINIYITLLSIVFVVRYIIEFLINFYDDEPQPVEISKKEQIILYFATAYIILQFFI